MSHKTLQRARALAYQAQEGCCVYCGASMWLEEPFAFAKRFGLTLGQARRFRCTAEHLVARCEGGADTRANIAAACLFCNQGRHRRKNPVTPARYQRRVSALVRSGGWHPEWAFKAGATEAGLFKAQSKVDDVFLKQSLTALAT